MRYHTVISSIWDDEKIRSVNPFCKLFYVYLFSNLRCNLTGIYKISPEIISAEIQLPKIDELIQQLMAADLIAYDFKRNTVWVKGKIKHHNNTWSHYESLKSMERDLAEFKDCSFYESIFTKYPEMIDLAISLEKLKKERYKSKAKTSNSVLASESVSVIVPTSGSSEGQVRVTR